MKTILIISFTIAIIVFIVIEIRSEINNIRRGRRYYSYFDFSIEIEKDVPEITNFTDLFNNLRDNRRLDQTLEETVDYNEFIFGILKDSINEGNYDSTFGKELLKQLYKFYEGKKLWSTENYQKD